MLLPTNGKNSADPTWSADGESVAYDDALSGKFREIAILDLATQKSSKVPGSDGLRSARWSPDGKYLVALGGFPSKLWLFSFDTQKWSELTSGDPNWPSWSRDSKYVYFLLSTNSVARVRISDHKVERLVSLQGFPFTARAWVGVTPDGRVMMTRDKGIEEVYAFDLDYK
jgi:Tol biopolymer transport system component